MSRADKKAQKLARAAAGLGQHPAKQARSASDPPSASKKPRALGIDHEDAWHRRLVWRFADLDVDAPSGAQALTVDDYKHVHEKLGEFEKQTCNEIWGQLDNGCKRYNTDEAHQNIKDRLTEIEKDDETAVHTLRLTGAFRVYGLLRENIFHVLWLDPAHEMFPSNKRNT